MQDTNFHCKDKKWVDWIIIGAGNYFSPVRSKPLYRTDEDSGQTDVSTKAVLDTSWGKHKFTHCGLVTPYGDRDLVNISSGSGLLPDGTKPWAEPIPTYPIIISRVPWYSSENASSPVCRSIPITKTKIENCIFKSTSRCLISGTNELTHLPLDNNLDDIFNCIFLNKNHRIPIQISLKYIPKSPIDNKPALVQVMAWRRTGDQAITRTNDDPVHWGIYATLGRDEFKFGLPHGSVPGSNFTNWSWAT